MKKFVKCKMVILLMTCTLVFAGCEAADVKENAEVSEIFAEASTETPLESVENESVKAESIETESPETESPETESSETESSETESPETEFLETESTEETDAVNKKATAAKRADTGANVSANAKADGAGVDKLADSGVSNASGSGWYTVYFCVAEDGFRKDVAQEIWNLVNAERAAAGLHELTWDEDIYEFACKRAQAIVTDFSHNGSGGYGENILMNWRTDANTLHMQWHDSSGHHDNYMRDRYDRGACAVYVYNGQVYAVENFRLTPYNPNEAVSSTPSSSPLIETPEQSAPAQAEPETWVASNGVTVYVMNGNAYTIDDGYDDNAHYQAWLEYSQSH